MLKKLAKRLLAAVIVMIMVFTTFMIFDPTALFPVAEATLSKTTASEPTVTFYVPELIYLNPASGTSSSGMTKFQYYVDRKTYSDSFALRTG